MTKVEARIIIEIMGRPPEHVKETLQTLVIKMGSEQGIKIMDKKYHDPVKIKDSNSLYSAFAEVELEFDSIDRLLFLIYTYSPSNLEIISPEVLKISNSDINVFFNALLERVHTHGAVTKRAVAERDILIRQMEFLRQNLGEKVTELLNQHVAEFQANAKLQAQKEAKNKAKEKPKKKSKKSKKG